MRFSSYHTVYEGFVSDIRAAAVSSVTKFWPKEFEETATFLSVLSRMRQIALRT